MSKNTHMYIFNREDNGGEQVHLTTSYEPNGDKDENGFPVLIYTQELTLQSYCNSAHFQLCGALITPTDLRELANEMESFENRLKAEFLQEEKES